MFDELIKGTVSNHTPDISRYFFLNFFFRGAIYPANASGGGGVGGLASRVRSCQSQVKVYNPDLHHLTRRETTTAWIRCS